MVATCSPHRSVGGSLLLPSPTHIHHHDATSAIHSLRRSLSSSPSRGPTFRLITSKSPSPSSQSPLSPLIQEHQQQTSPSSQQSHPISQTALQTTTANIIAPSPLSAPSPLAVPFPPSARIQRGSTRRASPMRTSLRSRKSPSSPMRRPLSLCSDSGNAAPLSPAGLKSASDQRTTRSLSPADKDPLEKDTGLLRNTAASDVSTFVSSNISQESTSSLLSVLSTASLASTSSPLKRSDNTMDLDDENTGSPVAKRRSLHGIPGGSDFNIFETIASNDAPSQLLDGSMDSASEATQDEFSNGGTSIFSSTPKRSSSLRKSTLQQRHGERPTFARSKPNPDLALDFNLSGPSVPRIKNHRVSSDNYLPPISRDSPFSSQGSLPNPSQHMMAITTSTQQGLASHLPTFHQPHPLSRTLTQSSSSSSLADDSPTHAPVRYGDRSRPRFDLSKSLPAGATRPALGEETQDLTERNSGTDAPYSTPQNYKLVKPFAAAFMSTGLISKRNRPLGDPRLAEVSQKAQMPDTPCKRPTMVFNAPSQPIAGSAFRKTIRHEFGTPSTPFGPHASKPTPTSFGNGTGIFGSAFGKASLNRSDSFVSNDGDDELHSPSVNGESQTTDGDFPPTPTKQVSGSVAPLSSASRFLGPDDGSHESTEEAMIFAPAAAGGQSPLSSEHNSSPLEGRTLFAQVSPTTPQQVYPPDPSGLSISGHGSARVQQAGNEPSSSASMGPPATPTGARCYFPQQPTQQRSVTPITAFAPDVDPGLTSRFDKVELIGTGEFSQVYRVTKSCQPPPQLSGYDDDGSQSIDSLQASVTDRVYAVKRSRHAYAGSRDRQKKMHEVQVLKAMGHADHVVELVDSWEDKNRLYIQTEFCEEGSLDLFLAQAGRKARLDDFRIWKVLLEMCLGLKHIHDAGFIHLDLKPANVLITFEGVLKIADFGMSAEWPAAPGIEGEGDREYIGPEVLMGTYDKPADIFALGLIIFEIAGNVELPDNGPSWQKLRTGDMSDVPSLTWSSESTVFRDSSGNPVSFKESSDVLYSSDESDEDDFGSPGFLHRQRREQQKQISSHFAGLTRRGELLQAPDFMVDPHHEQALDHIVRWMISPSPSDRPVVDNILETYGVKWAEQRRRAGATVFEGNWGPAISFHADDKDDDITATIHVDPDSEMTDV